MNEVRPRSRHTLPAVILTLLAGCATTPLTRAGEVVRVTENPEIVRGCEFVAEVPSANAWNRGPTDENAMRELRNEVGRRGANIVLMITSRTSGATSRAEAYLCADGP